MPQGINPEAPWYEGIFSGAVGGAPGAPVQGGGSPSAPGMPMPGSQPMAGADPVNMNAVQARQAAEPNMPVPPQPEIPDENASGMETTQGTMDSMDARGIAFPRLQTGMGGPAGVVMPEGENYNPYGGRDAYQDASVNKPAQLEAAINAGAQAESELGDTKADFFKRTQDKQAEELAVMQQHRIENAQEVAAQQARIDSATKRYTSDLADTGQFWRNPGNILAAFGAALVAAGSPGDRGIGLRTIQQAVQNDFAQRKQLADMHLGELRSNLSQYRQIAGDRELGDKLAFAESNRVAAMELERISAQFQGPLAKAKAAAISSELLRGYQLQMAQIHAAMVYNAPKVVDPRIKAAYSASGQAGPDGWQPYAKPTAPVGPGASQTGFSPVGGPGVPGAAPSGPKGSGGPITASSSGVKNLFGEPSKEQIDRINQRVPGAGDQLLAERRDVVQRMWSISNGDPKLFNKHMEEFEKHAEEDIKEISKAAQPLAAKVNGYRRMRLDMDVLQRTAEALHVDPDKLVGTSADVLTSREFMTKWDNTMNALAKADPKNANKYERQKQETADAVSRYRQLLHGNISTYFKEISGVAVHDSELDRLNAAVGTGWRGARVFLEDASNRSNAELNVATNTASHPVSGTLWRIQNGIGSAPLDSKGVRGKSNTDKAIENLKK